MSLKQPLDHADNPVNPINGQHQSPKRYEFVTSASTSRLAGSEYVDDAEELGP